MPRRLAAPERGSRRRAATPGGDVGSSFIRGLHEVVARGCCAASEECLADLILVLGDITRQHVDAIVNAANAGLVGGGGVDGAIHHAGGPAIMDECDRIREEKGGCPTGQSVATTAGKLPARTVIHTVGPRWRGGRHGEPRLLASAYRSSLELAASLGCRTVAFPSISTGAYGYPLTKAADVALDTIEKVLEERPDAFEEVRIVLFSKNDLDAFEKARRKRGAPA
jgi:O-acetyl-ADP-ribose deacetylase